LCVYRQCRFVGHATKTHVARGVCVMKYDEDYFERGMELGISGYSNYRWIPELTIPVCARIVEELNIRDSDTILDYGCAKGFYVKAFRLLHKQCWGFDISEYALSQVDREVKPFVSSDLKLFHRTNFDVVITKDVLEHIEYSNIRDVLRNIHSITNSFLFCVIPIGRDGKYIVPLYELDKTHIIREDLYWWNLTFEECGFGIVFSKYTMKHIKQNYEKWEEGNGFFLLRKL